MSDDTLTTRLRAQIATLRAALDPLAEKFLFPDDIEGLDDQDREDSRVEEVPIRRGQIRAAREALAATKPEDGETSDA